MNHTPLFARAKRAQLLQFYIRKNFFAYHLLKNA
jgi:hypothetical protein